MPGSPLRFVLCVFLCFFFLSFIAHLLGCSRVILVSSPTPVALSSVLVVLAAHSATLRKRRLPWSVVCVLLVVSRLPVRRFVSRVRLLHTHRVLALFRVSLVLLDYSQTLVA